MIWDIKVCYILQIWVGQVKYFTLITEHKLEADFGGIILGDFESASFRMSGGYGFGFNDWLVEQD